MLRMGTSDESGKKDLLGHVEDFNISIRIQWDLEGPCAGV